ncbi:DUF982 domain-containing protein [Mesorhizobium sp. 1B3]|uniref:DUF982 domain-containing protein n=1 Tax=Mesorhizobium sp. 1B3 TaxID=3243599 RepID=UPI003D99FE29
MIDGWFSTSVPVAVGIIGDIQHVFSARQALDLLNGNWREKGSAKHRAALRECLAAINGDAPSDAAREAFVEAAREARVLVGDDYSSPPMAEQERSLEG